VNPLRFHIVDVFAEAKYAGNQLAIFRNTVRLPPDEMQAIAREMHFSETTFILDDAPRAGGFDVRIFTPGEEVPFAGHPTLGTAHIIRREIAGLDARQIVLNLKVGPIPVTVHPAPDGSVLYWMRQVEPAFGNVLGRSAVAQVLGIDREDIDPRFPVEEVSTGLPHIIVPVKNLAALRRIRVARDAYFALIAQAWARPILAFSPETRRPENHVSVRMFADAFGIPEDAATGSGNGSLAAYLVRHRFWERTEIDVRSEQGHEIGRPSLLHLRARENDGHIEVDVGGAVVDVAQGELL
jgi:trans-2,3-dihydro-3-hydroxyanthranilate isomerase